MKEDKLKIYIIEFILVMFFLLTINFTNIFTKMLMSIILLVFMIISTKLIKSDEKPNIEIKKITFFMLAFGILYLALLYALGGKQGFYSAPIKFSSHSLINITIPYIVIILSLEIIRKNILLKGYKAHNTIILVIMVMLDVALNTNIHNLRTLNDYYVLIGFIIFASIMNNILFNSIVMKYKSSKPIIIYRILTTIYVYIIPIIPDINVFVESLIRIIYPYITYVIMNLIYSQNQEVISVKSKGKDIIISIVLCGVVSVLLLLVSGQFKYCALVIGSGSMTGTINKGDIIIYERYEKGEKLEENQIIVFNSEGKKIIHRIIDKKDSIKGIEYYTKGDANNTQDEGYRKEDDILGIVKYRIPQIGHFTLFINDLFKK